MSHAGDSAVSAAAPLWSIALAGTTPNDHLTDNDVLLLREVVQRLVLELEAAGYRVDEALVNSALGAEHLAQPRVDPETGP